MSPLWLEVRTSSGDLSASVCRLLRSQISAPIAASRITARDTPTSAPTFAPVLRPEKLESCCVLPPNDAPSPVGKLVMSICVALSSCDQ